MLKLFARLFTILFYCQTLLAVPAQAAADAHEFQASYQPLAQVVSAQPAINSIVINVTPATSDPAIGVRGAMRVSPIFPLAKPARNAHPTPIASSYQTSASVAVTAGYGISVCSVASATYQLSNPWA